MTPNSTFTQKITPNSTMSIFNTPNYHNFSLLFSPPTNGKFTFFYQQSNKSHKKVFQFQQHSKRHTLVKNKKISLTHNTHNNFTQNPQTMNQKQKKGSWKYERKIKKKGIL
jgi:hypothetical protein